MSLNKQRGNMYSFVTHTWNPVGGECPHKCTYCYVKRMKLPQITKKYSGEPRLYEKELIDLGDNKAIFVCNMTDLFAESVPDELRKVVIEHCNKYQYNSYLFQSKNPRKMLEFVDSFPGSSILCTTIESDWQSPSLAPAPADRLQAMIELKRIKPDLQYSVTIEPIMSFDHGSLVDGVRKLSPRFVSIGADSGGNKLDEPDAEDVVRLHRALTGFTQVVIKPNLNRIVK